MPVTDEQLTTRLAARKSPDPTVAADASLAIVRRAALNARPRRRGVRIGITSLIVAGVLAAPTTAVATKMFEAQTGRFGASGMTEVLAGDEWVLTSATDFDAYVATIAPRHLPVPDSFSWEHAVELVALGYPGEPTEVQRMGLVHDFERVVLGAWIDEWISATSAGNTMQADAALEVLRQSPRWEAMPATDGGGIRSGMWGFINRMALGGPEAMEWAQGFAQIMFADSWDGVERNEMYTVAFRPWDALVESYDGFVGGAESPIWDDYDALLAELSEGAVL